MNIFKKFTLSSVLLRQGAVDKLIFNFTPFEKGGCGGFIIRRSAFIMLNPPCPPFSKEGKIPEKSLFAYLATAPRGRGYYFRENWTFSEVQYNTKKN
jgi:hypothetical protein